MLDREFAYFKEHQDEIVRDYLGRHVVIIGDEVVGDYDSASEAYEATAAEHEVGTFLVQQALPGEGAYTQSFHSRILA